MSARAARLGQVLALLLPGPRRLAGVNKSFIFDKPGQQVYVIYFMQLSCTGLLSSRCYREGGGHTGGSTQRLGHNYEAFKKEIQTFKLNTPRLKSLKTHSHTLRSKVFRTFLR